MLYVMSDLHGEYDRYLAMLEQISFHDADTLYILGDVIDRGPQPVRLLQDMAARPNVCLLRGNHEATLSFLYTALDDALCLPKDADPNLQEAFDAWCADGGDVTLSQLRSLTRAQQYDLIDYLDDTPLYDVVDAGGRTYVLVHAGLGNFSPDKELDEYTYDELCCSQPDYTRQHFPQEHVYIVSGHTPTQLINGRAEILSCSHNLLIDCGAVFGGRLACLCLDTLTAYYT
jgi:serine/threonine protein phosphatase 1